MNGDNDGWLNELKRSDCGSLPERSDSASKYNDEMDQQSQNGMSDRADWMLPSPSSKSQGSFGKKTKPKQLKIGMFLNSEGSAGSVSRREASEEKPVKESLQVASLQIPCSTGRVVSDSQKNEKTSVLSGLITREEEPLQLQKALPAYIFLG